MDLHSVDCCTDVPSFLFTDATALTLQVLQQMTGVVYRLLLQWSDSACPPLLELAWLIAHRVALEGAGMSITHTAESDDIIVQI